MKTETIQKNFRLTKAEVKILEDTAKRLGCTQTEAIQLAIQQLDNSYVDAIHENEQVSGVNNDMLAILAKQLEEKDKQIESLTKLAQSAHDSLQAAQVLNAADKPQMALENIEQKEERKGFFQRIFGR